jgi:hypothetical protein
MKFHEPLFELQSLTALQGYSLQVFASGRMKLTLSDAGTQRYEYYADWPKRDTEAYRRQRKRSFDNLPNHFNIVDTLRAERDCRGILRIHEKGDNNRTADNAHVLISYSADVCFVVLNELIHTWELPPEVIQEFYSRAGERRGVSSIFNEYVPSFEHDWENATFTLKDYRCGYRIPKPPLGSSNQPDFDLDF